jgi:hypothetical protein
MVSSVFSSRTIPFDSVGNHKKLPTLEMEEWNKAAMEPQNKLLYLTFKFFNRIDIDKSLWFDELSDPRLMSALHRAKWNVSNPRVKHLFVTSVIAAVLIPCLRFGLYV